MSYPIRKEMDPDTSELHAACLSNLGPATEAVTVAAAISLLSVTVRLRCG